MLILIILVRRMFTPPPVFIVDKQLITWLVVSLVLSGVATRGPVCVYLYHGPQKRSFNVSVNLL